MARSSDWAVGGFLPAALFVRIDGGLFAILTKVRIHGVQRGWLRAASRPPRGDAANAARMDPGLRRDDDKAGGNDAG